MRAHLSTGTQSVSTCGLDLHAEPSVGVIKSIADFVSGLVSRSSNCCPQHPVAHRKFFFLLVRVYWLRCHSESPSLLSRAPPRISKGRRLILGPTSLSSQES